MKTIADEGAAASVKNLTESSGLSLPAGVAHSFPQKAQLTGSFRGEIIYFFKDGLYELECPEG